MRRYPNTARTLVSLLIGAIGVPPVAGAAQMPLAQYPAGTSWREPAPNVIITLDDSGSMGWYDGGGETQDERQPTSRMFALKTALRSIFDATAQNIPDGSIRMAWNTLNNCYAIPSAGGGCNNLNRMRVLDATHRANFLNWVGTPGQARSENTRLSAYGSTPTHRAFINAGDYLLNGSATAAESPWAKVPGTTAAPVLTCRRSYNVLMTDGGWNFTFASHGDDVARPRTNPNLDGSTFTLPDRTVYDGARTNLNTRLYSDRWGANVSNSNRTRAVSTLADLAFYYWATDLAPLLSDDLTPKIKFQGTETFGSGAGSATLPEYWNPRNDPAIWQHMSTYVIGFGDASEWRTGGSYSTYPVWNQSANDTFTNLPGLINGTIAWPDPIKSTLTLEESSNDRDALTTNGEARKVELWHMALNSRGKFIASTENSSLVTAFNEILGEIIRDSSQPITSFASASTSITRAATTQYTSGYEAENWTGYVRADTLSQSTSGNVTAAPNTGWGTHTVAVGAIPNNTSAYKLDAWTNAQIANRLILTWRDLAGSSGGTSFEWAADERYLSTTQKNLIRTEGAGMVSTTDGQRRLNFLRGDTTVYADTALRARASRQGDIVNSTLWYVAGPVSSYSFDNYLAFAKTHEKRLPMVYVGGNDGMLHGFSGEDGTEKIAYVPNGVIANLPDLTRKNYTHRYYVDGSPFSGDVNWGTSSAPNWRTLLVGTLGAGGKGYFVLDITTPGSSSTASGSAVVNGNFSKANAASLVVMDKTSRAGSTVQDADIGHIMVNPVLEDGNPQKTTQIVRMNNGRWALVLGNGYNSTNERPVLLVQYLDGDRSLMKIVASAATGASNGLSAPRLVDIDGNGTPDVIYAGDLKGNLWKFNVSSASPSDWAVAYGTTSSPLPLYTAIYSSIVNGVLVTTPQPITAPPIVRSNERGVAGLMVAFGTGRNLTEADRTDTSVQSIYSVMDPTRYKLVPRDGKQYVAVDTSDALTIAPVGTGVNNLQQQAVNGSAIAGGSSRDFWTVSQNNVVYSGVNAKKGWYLNLPESGERLLAQMSFYDESNIIELITTVPSTGGSTTDESCGPPPSVSHSYRTLLNIMDGKRPTVQVMDTNGDGVYSLPGDGYASRMSAAGAENRVTTKARQIRIGSDGKTDAMARLPEIPLRPTWRQLQ